MEDLWIGKKNTEGLDGAYFKLLNWLRKTTKLETGTLDLPNTNQEYQRFGYLNAVDRWLILFRFSSRSVFCTVLRVHSRVDTSVRRKLRTDGLRQYRSRTVSYPGGNNITLLSNVGQSAHTEPDVGTVKQWRAGAGGLVGPHPHQALSLLPDPRSKWPAFTCLRDCALCVFFLRRETTKIFVHTCRISELRWPLQIYTLVTSQPRYGRGEEAMAHKAVLLLPCPFNLPFPFYCDVAWTRTYFASCLSNSFVLRDHVDQHPNTSDLSRYLLLFLALAVESFLSSW
jgi:hypothetical protein